MVSPPFERGRGEGIPQPQHCQEQENTHKSELTKESNVKKF